MKDFFKSLTSPKGGKQGCLCEDGTYSKDCCDGSLPAQGIGSTVEQGVSEVIHEDGTRVIVRENG